MTASDRRRPNPRPLSPSERLLAKHRGSRDAVQIGDRVQRRPEAPGGPFPRPLQVIGLSRDGYWAIIEDPYDAAAPANRYPVDDIVVVHEEAPTCRITLFPDLYATAKREREMSVDELVDLLRGPEARDKAGLPLLSLMQFGDLPTAKNSLRHNGNVRACWGCAGDYDGERLAPEEAIERLTRAGVEALIYTTPSHRPDAPRWRVLCWYSEPRPPADHIRMTSRLAGALNPRGGESVLAGESWTWSQGFYFGQVTGGHPVEVFRSEGHPLDLLDELDDIAIGKPAAPREDAAPGATTLGELSEEEALGQIRAGQHYWRPAKSLIRRWVAAGIGLPEARARLYAAFDAVFPADRDDDWQKNRKSVPRWLSHFYGQNATRQEARHEAWEQAEAAFEQRVGDEPSAAASSVERKGFNGPQTIKATNPRSLQGRIVPTREWIVPEWIPKRRATALYGAGGEGKTTIAQQLATACALGDRWLGLPVRKCKSVLLFCEDDLEEMHIRQDDINALYGCSFDDLGDMLWLPRLGDDNVMIRFDSGRPIVTPLFDEVLAIAKAHGAELVIEDTVSDIFLGNENDRPQVRTFVQNGAAYVAREINGAMLILGHPSRAGIATGSGDSGSTGWVATFRSHLYLQTPGSNDDDDDTAEP